MFEDSGSQDLGGSSAADLAGERDDEQDGQHGAGQDNGGGHVCSLAGFSGEWVKNTTTPGRARRMSRAAGRCQSGDDRGSGKQSAIVARWPT